MKRLRILCGKGRNRGTTLVETIVAFALTCIFLASAASALMSFMSVYAKVESMIDQQQIGATLIERVAGTMQKCSKDADGAVEIKSLNAGGKNAVSVLDSNGRRVLLFVNSNGYLQLTYSGSEGDTDTEWYYGSGFYMNNNVSELHFERSGTHMIMVSLTLRNVKNGTTYTLTKLVDCETEKISVV